jgi:hypothetical protein
MYLPIGQIAESERGNKKYFDLGLKAFWYIVDSSLFKSRSLGVLRGHNGENHI